MTPQEALDSLYNAEDWHAMLSSANQASVAVDLSFLNSQEIKNFTEIPSSFVDDRCFSYLASLYNPPCPFIVYSLSDQVPQGYKALLSTGNGNCLFNSISTLLFGNEDSALELRLASVLHAINHLDHYLGMVLLS